MLAVILYTESKRKAAIKTIDFKPLERKPIATIINEGKAAHIIPNVRRVEVDAFSFYIWNDDNLEPEIFSKFDNKIDIEFIERT